MIFKNKRNIILLILIFITVLILSSCSIKKENPNVIDLSGKLDFSFKIYYEGLDEFENYTNLYFEYDSIKTEVYESMKLNEKGLPVVIKEDIDFDGKYELVIYLLEKQRNYFKEIIYFLDYDSGSELSLEQINQKLNISEELEIVTALEENVFENENIVLSYIKRKEDAFEVNQYDDRAFSLTKDISKENNNITVEIYEDEIIRNINYIYNENLPSFISDTRQTFLKDIIELVKISKNGKGLLINTQGSYLIDYKDVNNDNTEDIIFICDTRENKILNDNVYYLNGIDLERKYIYVNELSILPNDYPLHLINLYSVGEPGERTILALRNDETFYLTDKIAGASIVVRVKDFNDDGENEIAIINDPRYTFGRERFVYIYKEKYFEKIPFSTDSIFDIVESLFEYSIEYIEDGQACLATIKDKKNNDQIVIKISSDVAKPNFEFVYHESIVSNIVNNGINEIISLCVINTENWRFVTILDIEVIYEMQNNEFVVKDIKNTLISDLSVVYGFDEYKFEIIENSIIDTNP